MIIPFKKTMPAVHPSVFIAYSAAVIGRVKIGQGSSVWFGAVLRGDIHRIQVGRMTSLQDNCVLHVDYDKPCVVGDSVVVGHQATIHGCRVEDGALVGIGARVLSGARVGKEAVVAAGAVVKEGFIVPARTVVAGVPAKPIRKVTPAEIKAIRGNARRYEELSRWYRDNLRVPFSKKDIHFLENFSGILE